MSHDAKKAHCRRCGGNNPRERVTCEECDEVLARDAALPGAAARWGMATEHWPGSDGKLVVLIQRAALGVDLFRAGDAGGFGDDVRETAVRKNRSRR